MNGFKMANAIKNTQIFRQFAVRNFAANAKPKTVAGQMPDVQITNVNETIVATIQPESPITKVSIFFKAGSRYETYDNLGVTHVLRHSCDLANKHSTGFGVTRNIQQVGGNLSCTNSREMIVYSAEITCDKTDTILKYLKDVATAQSFRPWEIADRKSLIAMDLARITPQVRAVDLLHRAAFRTGLGNSLFCPKHHVGRLTSETLQHYVTSNYTANRCAVVGIGIDHQVLVGYTKSFQLESGSGGARDGSAQKFNAGDMRIDKHSDWSHVAIGKQGGSLANQKEALAFAVLQQIAGVGIAVKRGNYNGAIGEKLSAEMDLNPFGFNTFNASYSDNGLFGVVISAETQNIGKAINVVVKALKQGSVKSEDVNVGKDKLKAAILMKLENTGNLVSGIGKQALVSGNVNNTSEIISAIDGLTDTDINKAAAKIASGPWAIGAVGNLENVPYSSEL